MVRNGLFEIARVLLTISVVLFTGACARSAANMAATQPEAKDLSVLTKGTHRDKVVARLGAPESSTPYDDMIVDVYKFVQGYSAGARTARVFTHSTLSIATLGLWEVAGTAIEGYARGNTVSVRVVYDSRGQLESYEILDGQTHSTPRSWSVPGLRLNRSLRLRLVGPGNRRRVPLSRRLRPHKRSMRPSKCHRRNSDPHAKRHGQIPPRKLTASMPGHPNPKPVLKSRPWRGLARQASRPAPLAAGLRCSIRSSGGGNRGRSRCGCGSGCSRLSRRGRQRCRRALTAFDVDERLPPHVLDCTCRGEIAEPHEHERIVHHQHGLRAPQHNAADHKSRNTESQKSCKDLVHAACPPAVLSHAPQQAFASSRTRRM